MLQKSVLQELPQEVQNYIKGLEDQVAALNQNGAIKLIRSLNIQLGKLADQIEEADIDITSSDDKVYERFLNTVKVIKDVSTDFDSLISKHGMVKKEEEVSKIPLLERAAQENKRNS